MKAEIDDKIKEIVSLLEKDERINSLKRNKQKLLYDEIFLEKIKKLQELDIYSEEYKNLKKELFQNPDFMEFKHLENEIHLLILAINQKLKKLTEERSCSHENH